MLQIFDNANPPCYQLIIKRKQQKRRLIEMKELNTTAEFKKVLPLVIVGTIVVFLMGVILMKTPQFKADAQEIGQVTEVKKDKESTATLENLMKGVQEKEIDSIEK